MPMNWRPEPPETFTRSMWEQMWGRHRKKIDGYIARATHIEQYKVKVWSIKVEGEDWTGKSEHRIRVYLDPKLSGHNTKWYPGRRTKIGYDSFNHKWKLVNPHNHELKKVQDATYVQTYVTFNGFYVNYHRLVKGDDGKLYKIS